MPFGGAISFSAVDVGQGRVRSLHLSVPATTLSNTITSPRPCLAPRTFSVSDLRSPLVQRQILRLSVQGEEGADDAVKVKRKEALLTIKFEYRPEGGDDDEDGGDNAADAASK